MSKKKTIDDTLTNLFICLVTVGSVIFGLLLIGCIIKMFI